MSLGQAAELFFPPALASRTVELLTVSADRPDDDLLTRQQAETLHALEALHEATPDQLRARAGKPLTSILPALIKLGAIERRITIHPHEPKANTAFQIRLAVDSPPALKAPRQKALVSYLDIRLKTGAGDGWIDEATALRASGASRDTLNRLIAAELVVRRAVNRAVLESAADFAPTLTPEQAIAWREMETLLESEHPSPLLLRGVTGSGKTELLPARSLGLFEKARAQSFWRRNARDPFVRRFGPIPGRYGNDPLATKYARPPRRLVLTLSGEKANRHRAALSAVRSARTHWTHRPR
ncbi:MAG: hypothetical protein R2843_11855 [Thermomicrobiales bacterium]